MFCGIIVPIQGVSKIQCTTKTCEDVCKLTHRRIREDFLQIILNKGNCSSHDCGNTTDCCDNECKIDQFSSHRRCTEEREHTGNEIQSCVDHCCCVDESGNWCWPFHSVWKPNVKWELSGFTNCTNEHHSKRHLEFPWINISDIRLIENHCVVEGAKHIPKHNQSNDKENVTNKAKHKGTGEIELYNLAKDPHERSNLAKARQGRTKRLAKQLNKLLPE